MAECGTVSCCPFTVDREVQYANQLPAAGAFTTQSFSVLPAGTTKISYWITYTRGAVGGFPQFRAEWSNGVDTPARGLILDQGSLATAAPEGSVNLYQETLIGPAPSDGNPLVYVLEFEVPPGATQARLTAAELGISATPGEILIALTGLGAV